MNEKQFALMAHPNPLPIGEVSTFDSGTSFLVLEELTKEQFCDFLNLDPKHFDPKMKFFYRIEL